MSEITPTTVANSSLDPLLDQSNLISTHNLGFAKHKKTLTNLLPPFLSLQVNTALGSADEADARREQLRIRAAIKNRELGLPQTTMTNPSSSPGAAILTTAKSNPVTPSKTQITPKVSVNIGKVRASQSGEVSKGLKKTVLQELIKERDDLCTQTNGLMKENGELIKAKRKADTDVLHLNQDMRSKDKELEDKSVLIGQLNTNLQDKNKELATQAKQLGDKDALIKTLTEDNTKLKDLLEEAKKALKDGGKYAKFEQNGTVAKEIAKWIKDVGFRTKIFVRDDALTKFTTTVYSKVKDKLGLEVAGSEQAVSVSEFCRIYESVVQTELGNRRSYVQTSGMAKMKSKS